MYQCICCIGSLGRHPTESQRVDYIGRILWSSISAKSVFLAVNASLRIRWLNNVSGVHLVQVSLFLIVQQGSGDFFRYQHLLLSIGWRIMQILRQRRRKTTNTAPTTLSAMQAASQSTFNQ